MKKNLLKKKGILHIATLGYFFLETFLSCSHLPSIQRQKYASYSSERALAYSLNRVYQAVRKSIQEYKILNDSHEKPTSPELSPIPPITIQTDWIEEVSQEQYQIHEEKQNAKKCYLKSRLRYTIHLEKTAFATLVKIKMQQQVQPLNRQGEPSLYRDTQPDSSFAHELLEKIQKTLLEATSE
jgi:hypothetical protein